MSQSNHHRRLEALEVSIAAHSDDANLCFKCQGPGSYRRAIDVARLKVGAMGGLFGVNPEECRTKLKGMSIRTRSDADHCRKCGGLTAVGAIREVRAKWGLD